MALLLFGFRTCCVTILVLDLLRYTCYFVWQFLRTAIYTRYHLQNFSTFTFVYDAM